MQDAGWARIGKSAAWDIWDNLGHLGHKIRKKNVPRISKPGNPYKRNESNEDEAADFSTRKEQPSTRTFLHNGTKATRMNPRKGRV